MPVAADISGRKFHRLTAIRPTGGRVDGRIEWECRCECGNPQPVYTSVTHLKSGNTRSCGCLQREKAGRSGRLVTSHSLPKVCVLASCGKRFLGTNKQKFCSRKCKEAEKLAARQPKPCQNSRCDRLIPAARSNQRYCSPRCKQESRYPLVPPNQCPICGAVVPRQGRSIYCPGPCRRVAASRLKLANRIGSPQDQLLILGLKLEQEERETRE